MKFTFFEMQMTNNELYTILQSINVIKRDGTLNSRRDAIFKKHPNVLAILREFYSHINTNDTKTLVRMAAMKMYEFPKCKHPDCSNKVSFKKAHFVLNDFCSYECYWNDPAVKQQSKVTKHQRYGSPTYNNREKAKQTSIEKYGTEHPMQTEEKKQAVRQAKQELNQELVIEKRHDTMIKKYGAATMGQAEFKSKNSVAYNILTNKEKLEEALIGKTKTELAHELNVSYQHIHRYCQKYDIEYNAESFRSIPEQQIREKIIDRNPSLHYTTNDKRVIPPYELDLFFPEKKIAIEFNGIFWHSEKHGNKNRSYHLKKLKSCQSKGIHLIQVWGNEWESHPEIVLSRLFHKLGMTKNKIMARKCKVVEMSAQSERRFFETSHIQGYAPSTVCYGLVHDDKVVAAMSFVKNRFSKKGDFELLRFASALDTGVCGGAQKLFCHFVRCNPNVRSMVTYSNKRWNLGEVYSSLGFKLSNTASPNYFYFYVNGDVNKLWSRNAFQKHKLSKKLEHFNPERTEWQNMTDNGYDRIWDCGNDVFIWERDC